MNSLIKKCQSVPELYKAWKEWRRWLKDRRLDSGLNIQIFASDAMEGIKEIKGRGDDVPMYLNGCDKDALIALVEDITVGRWPTVKPIANYPGHSGTYRRQYCPKCGLELPVAWGGDSCPTCRFAPQLPVEFRS